jgi:hypothetical protein
VKVDSPSFGVAGSLYPKMDKENGILLTLFSEDFNVSLLQNITVKA